MRDKLKTPTYWDDYIDRRDKTISRFTPLVFDETIGIKNQIGFAYDVYMSSYKQTIAFYSAGFEINIVKKNFIRTIDYIDNFIMIAKTDKSYTLKEYIGGYDTTYQLLSLAILLKIDMQAIQKIVSFIDFYPQKDIIWEEFIKVLGVKRKDMVDKLVWGEAYQTLLDSIQIKDSNLLEKFVKQWYGKMSGTYWFNSHNSKHNTYFGYWCFEALAVSKIFGIDDIELLKHPNYPLFILK